MKPNLAIAFVAQGFAPDVGGVETHTHDLARALLARGHRVRVLCLDGAAGREPYSVRDEEQGDVRVRRLAYRYADQHELRDMVRNPRADASVRSWLAEEPCDVVHVHHLTGFGMGALYAAAASRHALVMTLHDYWSLCPRGQMLRYDGVVCTRIEHEACGACIAATWPHLMQRGPTAHIMAAAAAAERTQRALAALTAVQRFIAPSEALAEKYVDLGVTRERIEIVEHGLDAAALGRAVARERTPRQGGALRLGVLGSVQPSKGVLELAQALVRSRAALELHVHGALGAYHGDTRYVAALSDVARSHAQIQLHGPYTRAELPRILAGLDGVAVPSIWREVWGTSAREARAAGLPVLVADTGGLADAAQSGRAGLIVPAGDWAAWERALQRFASDAAARARWAAEPHTVRDVSTMARDTEHVYTVAQSTLAQRAP